MWRRKRKRKKERRVGEKQIRGDVVADVYGDKKDSHSAR